MTKKEALNIILGIDPDEYGLPTEVADNYHKAVQTLQDDYYNELNNIIKDAYIRPTMISNNGDGSYVLDADITGEDYAKLTAAYGYGFNKIKIKILCK